MLGTYRQRNTNKFNQLIVRASRSFLFFPPLSSFFPSSKNTNKFYLFYIYLLIFEFFSKLILYSRKLYIPYFFFYYHINESIHRSFQFSMALTRRSKKGTERRQTLKQIVQRSPKHGGNFFESFLESRPTPRNSYSPIPFAFFHRKRDAPSPFPAALNIGHTSAPYEN